MKRAVMIFLVIVLVCAGAYCGWRYYSDVYRPNKQITDADKSQRELFDQIDPDPDDDDVDKKDGTSDDKDGLLHELTEINSDSVGWITIDGTVIDYPIVQSDDNYYYLDHGFDGEYNWGLGCPFLDYRCKSDFSDFCSIAYAHHISGYQAMFSDITLYKDPGFMESYPVGILTTKTKVHTVRFFAYMILPNPSFAYNFDFDTKVKRDAYIDNIYENAEYTSVYTAKELKEKKDINLLLLSTCTYEYWNARGVLAGVIE